ncbi:MAG: CHAT domain-containing tetratricopeptide repeat protein [Sterolibacterium sp.]
MTLRWLALLFALFIGSVAAAEEPQVPPRTIHDILAVLDSRPVNTGKLAAAHEILETPPPPGLDGAELAEFHMKRARAANELGLVGPQISELRRVIELGGGREPYRAWAELSGAEFNGGNFRNALAAKTKALEIVPRNQRGFILSMHAQLSDMYRRLGDFETARQHVRNAEGLLAIVKQGQNWTNYQYNWQAFVEDALGRIDFSSGHYAEAEVRFRRALDYREKDVVQNLERLNRNLPTTPPQINVENHRDAAEAWLASALRAQGNLREAEVRARNLAYRCIEQRGPESLHTNIMLQQLVQVLMEKGRSAEALLLIDRILKNFDKLGVPQTSYMYVNYRRIKANALTAQKRWKEALAEFEAMQAALATDPQLVETLGAPSLGLIRVLIAVRQNDQAVIMGEKLVRQTRALMGPNAYDAAEAAGYYGAALAAAGRDAEALDALRQAVTVMIPAVAEEADRSGRRFTRLSYIIENYLRVLVRIRGTPLEKARAIDAAAEAFIVADALRGQSVQQAMAASAARAAAGTPELAQLVREEQDMRQERDALYQILADLMSRPSDQMLPKIITDMQVRTAEFDLRQKSLHEQLHSRFPDYADLISPRPASIAQIQAVLKPGEALLSVLPSEDQTFVWAIPARGASAFAASPLPSAEVNRLVNHLRAALDPQEFQIDKLPVFDGAVAHQLYAQLLAPVQAGWKGSKHLIVAAGGALSRLPFALLVTAPPAAAPEQGPLYAHYADWQWLAHDLGISQLPAASSLVTLRRMKAGAADRLVFAGFGDPNFSGSGTTAAGKARGIRTVALPISLRTRQQRGEDVGWIDYSRISPLPDTREEILSLAKALGANAQRDVFLGSEASKDKVFAADLAHRKVVAFATHGLLPGDFPGVDQPALALANPGGGKHGLLTLDDILTLKLDADWVVLSACNTAGGDGVGAEAVSGLGRGFFYAGSRSLLVTHWPVESVSAKRLVVGVFDALAAAPALPRAEALRRSMLQLMREKGEDGALVFSYAHPLFWAPYALVGDGGQ